MPLSLLVTGSAGKPSDIGGSDDGVTRCSCLVLDFLTAAVLTRAFCKAFLDVVKHGVIFLGNDSNSKLLLSMSVLISDDETSQPLT